MGTYPNPLDMHFNVALIELSHYGNKKYLVSNFKTMDEFKVLIKLFQIRFNTTLNIYVMIIQYSTCSTMGIGLFALCLPFLCLLIYLFTHSLSYYVLFIASWRGGGETRLYLPTSLRITSLALVNNINIICINNRATLLYPTYKAMFNIYCLAHQLRQMYDTKHGGEDNLINNCFIKQI